MIDPNELVLVHEYAHYIYGDDYGNFAARVDAVDYWFFSRWRWFVKFDKHGKKPYLFRVTDSGRASGRQTTSIFLHVAIKERADPNRPIAHSMVDHEDGDSLNCLRDNLSYATPSMNRRSARRKTK